MAQPDTGGRNPLLRTRIPADTQRKMRTRAAYLDISVGEYLTTLIEKDAEETFQRIDRPNNGGRK